MATIEKDLRSQLAQLAQAGAMESRGRNAATIVQDGLLVFTGKIFVFRNTVYQISSIASVSFSDDSERHSEDIPIPAWYWLILVAGVLTLGIGVGIILIGVFIWLLYMHNQRRTRVRVVEKYGVRVEMNSSSSTILVSRSREFALEIVQHISRALNADEPEPFIANFNGCSFEDKSVNVDTAIDSALISGQVVGNVNS
jgi:Family of unknown function (DUF6232)